MLQNKSNSLEIITVMTRRNNKYILVFDIG